MKRKDELKELRELDEDQLVEKIRSTEEELMNLRFRHASGQLEQSAQLGTLRRRVARAKTLVNELRSAGEQQAASE